MTMLSFIAVLCLLGALILLLALSIVDLRTWLLPNEMVTGFMTCGLIFHLSTVFAFASVIDMALGAFIGGGSLYLIRGVSNMFYRVDTLGLGDVKLLAAAGVWFGPHYILIAMTCGAFAGLLHGLAYVLYIGMKTGTFPGLSRLALPAGPGFAAGIVVTAFVAFEKLPAMLFS